MQPDEAIASLDTTAAEAQAEIAKAPDSKTLEELRVRYLGRKGPISALRSTLGKLEGDERKALGQKVNEVTAQIEKALEEKRAATEATEREERLVREAIDVTLPGRRSARGNRNPITIVTEMIVDAFIGLGYRVAEGPEVESDYYNFQALNIPQDHPARSMWDTLYVEPSGDDGEMPLFRTHTSPVQARVMEAQPPPVFVVVPGRCARRETVDASHLASFMQIEGLAVDWGITFADLRGTLQAFAKALFGPEQRVRLVPSYFPFTEPSAEVEIVCFNCGGEGCRTCGREGWIELMGAGMVHPNVFKAAGYPEGITGFAFGVGIERVAMARFGVPDIRSFYENDMSFLEVF